MGDTFKALVIDKTDEGQTAAIQDLTLNDLPDEDVLVEIEFSTVNYKDGLAITGASPICRTYPMVGGIDYSGTVIEDKSGTYAAGDKIVMNGWGAAESHWGGYAQKMRVKPDHLITLPKEFSSDEAMAIGTAGYTAMLCVLSLEDHGVTPNDGPVLVTGAAGGVGSVAISLLSKLGYEVIASSGRAGQEGDYLRGLGASDVIDRNELSEKGRPLGKERWAAAVDSVGSHTLANVLASTKYGGAVAACGLAQGFDLPATVMPFILRNVALLGVDSVMAPKERRQRAWDRLAVDLDKSKLSAMITRINMSDLIETAPKILSGDVRGRLVVDVNA